MDPALYAQMQPLAQSAVAGFGGGRGVSERDVDRMVDEVVGRGRFNHNRHGNADIRDFARFLILLNLYYMYGYTLNPLWLLYFGGLPFFPGFGRPPFFPGPPFRPPVRPVPPIGNLPPRRPGRPPNQRPPQRGPQRGRR